MSLTVHRPLGVIGLALALSSSAWAEDAKPAASAATQAANGAPAAAAPTPAPSAAAPKVESKTEAKDAKNESKDAADARRERPASHDEDSLLPSEHKAAKKTEDRPLALRKTNDKPLELIAPSPTNGWGYKLALCGIIIAGAVWLLKKRALLKPPAQTHAMTIVGRTPIGVRNELILVDVDGQKLLLGVTPSSITRLAVLPVLGDVPSLADPEVDPMTPAEQEPGFELAVKNARDKLERFAARLQGRVPAERAIDDDGEIANDPEPPPARAAVPASEGTRRKIAAAPKPQQRPQPPRPQLQSRPDERPRAAQRSERRAELAGEQAESLMRIRRARGV
jgi:flagellar biosynthetic protein FliO